MAVTHQRRALVADSDIDLVGDIRDESYILRDVVDVDLHEKAILHVVVERQDIPEERGSKHARQENGCAMETGSGLKPLPAPLGI